MAKNLVAFLIRYLPRPFLQNLSRFGKALLPLFYAGKNVQCPICEGTFRKFLPYGRIHIRSNALCPACLSLERHRLLWLFLKETTPYLTQPSTVLHIAPEPCLISRLKNIQGKNYITADLESPLADIKMDVHHTPFDKETFDLIICNHVLEHVENDQVVMKELYRILKPGGMGILQVPFFHPIPETTLEDPAITDPREREKHFGQSDHVRKYGKDYPTRIKQAGFEPITSSFASTLSDEVVMRYGIVKSEIIYGGKKTLVRNDAF